METMLTKFFEKCLGRFRGKYLISKITFLAVIGVDRNDSANQIVSATWFNDNDLQRLLSEHLAAMADVESDGDMSTSMGEIHAKKVRLLCPVVDGSN